MSSGDQMRPFYEMWRARFPSIFTTDLTIRPDSTDTAYHIESGADGGVPWTCVRAGYVIAPWQAAHEILGHMADKLTNGALREPYWKWRFGGYVPAPQSWYLASLEPNAIAGVWAHLPIESLAEAARLGFTTDGPDDRSMDWGKDIDIAGARTFFESRFGGVPVSPVDYSKSIWTPSPNYSLGRSGAPRYVNEHWTVASSASTIATFQSSFTKVSAHYLVARDGTVYQFVRERDTAWHNAMPTWNDIAIGIEHEHELGQDWPQIQLDSSASLHRDISARQGIPLTRTRCLGHNETGYATSCPGDLPIDRIIEEDDLFTDADRAKLDRIYAMTNAEGPRVWTQRLQDWLSRALKSIPTYARPTDFTGPDVTSGQPRT